MDWLRILYPRVCLICGKVLAEGKICKECRRELPYCQTPRCCRCGKHLENETQEYCGDCQKKQHRYVKGLAPFIHTGRLRDAVYRIKYKNKREYLDFFVEEIVRHHKKEIMMWGCDLLIPVPLHVKKKRMRGFNQAEVFAKRLSKRLGIPLDCHSLKRIRNTRPQKEFDDVQRRKNLQNAFKVTQNVVKSKKIILVDDIYTTGSTIDACAEALLQAGAKEVYFICLTIGSGY